MPSLNEVTIMGNLGADPDVHEFEDGGIVTRISVATTDKWRDKDTGVENEKTEWHRIIFYRRQAEIARDYLHKGSCVWVRGKLETRRYEKDGDPRFVTEIRGLRLQLMGSSAPHHQEEDHQAEREMATGSNRDDDYDDDIPF